MTDNAEPAEIDLEAIEDTTDFSDQENIPVEHINFEFEQNNKYRGQHRKMTIFNDTHCYQSVKNKHQNKFKYRIDISFLDPRPFRQRKVEWKWLYGAAALFLLDAVLYFGGLLDTSSIHLLGLFIGVTVVAIMCLLAFFHYSSDRVYFRSQYGKVRLLEFINMNPDKVAFRNFITKFIMQIKKSKTAKGYNQSKFLARELREIRRLKDEGIVPIASYEKAKERIFKHEAFSSAD